MTNDTTRWLRLCPVSHQNRDFTLETAAAVTDEAVKKDQEKHFQVLINNVNQCRKVRLVSARDPPRSTAFTGCSPEPGSFLRASWKIYGSTWTRPKR